MFGASAQRCAIRNGVALPPFHLLSLSLTMLPDPSSVTYVGSAELAAELTREHPPKLLHVLPEASFQERHLTGSVNACVYEVAFAEKATAALPDKAAPVVVYGQDSTHKAAEVAFKRLGEMGYRSVRVLAGGLAAAAGHLPVESGEAAASPWPAGQLALDPEQSRVRWIGRNPFNHHEGLIPVKGGHLRLAEGKLLSGEVTLDAHHLTCTDLADGKLNDLLIGHLRSDDFLDTANHPEAHATLINVSPLPAATPGQPQYHLTLDLTLRGQTHPVEADALLATREGRASLQWEVTIDRTKWGVCYGSGKVFEQLGMHIVNDRVTLEGLLFTVAEG